MSRIALGVTVFKRTERLAQLLSSVGPPVETVYVGDNGEITDDKQRVYSRDYPFDLEVLDLEYDSGLGHSRNEIFEELSEEYLVIADSDMEMPGNVSVLGDILDARPDLGAVSGLIFERGNLTGASCDLFREQDLLVKDIRGEKESQFVDGHPFVEFDFIPNAAMFRRECLADYSWDPEYVIGYEHVDFYVAHASGTEWRFGTCPSVVFPHFPGGDTAYMSERNDKRKLERSKRYFLDKWGFRQVVPIQGRWVESFSDVRLQTPRFLAGYGARLAIRRLPAPAKAWVMDVRDRLQYA